MKSLQDVQMGRPGAFCFGMGLEGVQICRPVSECVSVRAHVCVCAGVCLCPVFCRLVYLCTCRPV